MMSMLFTVCLAGWLTGRRLAVGSHATAVCCLSNADMHASSASLPQSHGVKADPCCVVAAQTKPVGFSNDFLVGTAGHPFLGQMLAALPKWNKRFGSKYPTVMFSTGPMFVSYQVG